MVIAVFLGRSTQLASGWLWETKPVITRQKPFLDYLLTMVTNYLQSWDDPPRMPQILPPRVFWHRW